MTKKIYNVEICGRYNKTFSACNLLPQQNKRRHDTQYNDIQHNDIQHNDTQHNDTQHNDIHQNYK